MSNPTQSQISDGIRPSTRNLTGQKFGRVTVISFSHYRNNNTKEPYWNCLCDCGTQKTMPGRGLYRGKAKSCGCYNKEMSSKKNSKHGMSNTNIHDVWRGMLDRCDNENNARYKDYGGRGIKVCNYWRDFENFYNDVKDGYKKGLTIERVDVNGNYEKSNFRWATKREQQHNKRDTIYLTVNGLTATVIKWSEISGTNQQTIATRYFRHWTHEECVYGKKKELLN